MLRIHDLPPEAGRSAIETGEFPVGVIGEGNVAVVMTQNWCPDWLWMRSWLNRMQRAGEPAELDIDVYQFVYNRVDFYDEFMRFKETTFGNHLIPYVRYYSAGSNIGESNQISSGQFVGWFRT